MLSISPISTNVVNFNSKTNELEQKPTYEFQKFQTEATTDKKWGVGIASWVLPGLGQAINGEWGKGFAFFGLAGILPYFFAALTGLSLSMGGISKNNKVSKTAVIAGLSGVLLSAIGGRIWSCVDAVRNAKSEVFVPVKKS